VELHFDRFSMHIRVLNAVGVTSSHNKNKKMRNKKNERWIGREKSEIEKKR
jgi:hypothetical protein